MINFQKIIKYFAIAFAMFLIVSIISGIIYGLSNVSYFIGNKSDVMENMKITTLESNVASLRLDVNSSSLIIKSNNDNNLKIETNNKNIEIKEDNNTLILRDKKKMFFNKTEAKIIVYLPEIIYDSVAIELGAGKLDIENLTAKDISIELGAGKTTINQIVALNSLTINSGAGKLDILNGSINNLDLDMGTGSVYINSAITGNSRVDCGIGSINMNLLGDNSNYELKINKGIGTITVDNNKISDNTVIGSGNSKIDIDGGIGEINIKYSE